MTLGRSATWNAEDLTKNSCNKDKKAWIAPNGREAAAQNDSRH